MLRMKRPLFVPVLFLLTAMLSALCCGSADRAAEHAAERVERADRLLFGGPAG